MKKTTITLFMLMLACSMMAQLHQRRYMKLDGQWMFDVDRTKNRAQGYVFKESVYLPGTTDTNKKGNPPARTNETTRLTRLHSFVGKALYKKKVTIPMTWKGSTILLHMERTKPTTVFVDGQNTGSCDKISTPQCYDLTRFLTSGEHELCILVDNSEEAVPKQIVSNSHAYTEDTQTNWNGILGEFYLEARPDVYIDNLKVETDAANHELSCTVEIHGKLKKDMELAFILIPTGSDYGVIMHPRGTDPRQGIQGRRQRKNGRIDRRNAALLRYSGDNIRTLRLQDAGDAVHREWSYHVPARKA